MNPLDCLGDIKGNVKTTKHISDIVHVKVKTTI
jgi:hypothetical protein